MKLTHPMFSAPIDFTQSVASTLVIEDPFTLIEFIAAMKHQIGGVEGPWILSVNNTPVSVDKNVVLIVDPFTLDWTNRTLTNKLLKMITDVAIGEDYYLKTTELLNQIKAFGVEILDEVDLNLDMNEDLDAIKLLKLLDIKFHSESIELDEELVQYMEIVSEFVKIKLFVLVNIFSYLSPVQVESIIKDIQYQHARILFIESRDNVDYRIGETKILDRDLCEIDIQ